MRAIFFPLKPQPTHTTEELLCAKSIPAGASTHLSIGPWYRPSRFVIEDEPQLFTEVTDITPMELSDAE